jgi:hypothetical protein
MLCPSVRERFPVLPGHGRGCCGGIDFASPFGSLDLQLKKDIRCGKHATVSLMGEAFNILNETNIRGTTNANYSGRNI